MAGTVKRGAAALLALAAAALAAPVAVAQQAQPPASDPGTPIGPPQLRDFDLAPRNRATPPRPAPTPATPPAEQPSRAEQPAASAPRPGPAARSAPVREQAPVRSTAGPEAPRAGPADASASDAPPATAPAQEADAPPVESLPAAPAAPASEPETEAPASTSGSLGDSDGPPLWLFLIGGLALGLFFYVVLKRRRVAARRRELLDEVEAETVAAVPVAPAAPRVPRPDPVPRPWLEIELTPERTTADPAESIVEFELVVRNNGGSTAQGVKLQAKLICSTPDQDKEIAAFHRKKPGEHRTLDVPDIPAGQEIRLKGQVDIKREDIKALRMDQRLIWVPLVAVNAFYGWGAARTGQTSKSFLVGREQAETKDKMAPFRLDLGPRVYRTVGQRPYKIERRV